MGKTPKPLRILAVNLPRWDELTALNAQGHEVYWADENGYMSNIGAFDLVIGPTCWLMDEAHRKYLPLALAEARRRRYPPTKKESA